jgi:beta-galactosidase
MQYYGAAYYPEQETPEEVVRDAQTMKSLGFNVARLGEFAWCRFEPRDGVFDFAWFDHALAALAYEGVQTVLCTPSACPPIWMVEAHPEVLYVDNRGVTRPFGGRRHYCYNQPVYRRFCQRIATEMGRRYGGHADILAFHIDNELAQEGTGRCQCAYCVGAFSAWLERRYGTIAEFNRRAGTVFWSQTYERFDQVRPPLKSIEPNASEPIDCFADNPTLRLDWERFCSESITSFQNQQVAALRAVSQKPITTNACGFWTNGNDLYESFRGLDVAGGDIYPSLRSNEMYGATCDFAFHRGLKRGKFWVLETSSGGGQGVWARQGIPQPFPGALRQNAVLAFAADANLATYFQYKMFRAGAEQLEAAVIDIDGVPRRRFREYQQAALEIRSLGALLDASQVRNEVAILFDYESLWAIRIKPFSRGFSYQNQLTQIYTLLATSGIGCDIVSQRQGLAGYKLVILPTPVVLSDEARQELKDFVRAGGTVLTNFLAGIKNPDNTAARASVPAGLVELFGMRVAEGEPVQTETWQSTVAQVRLQLSGEAVVSRNAIWSESLEPQGAEVIGRYLDTYRQGEALATCNRYGAGRAYYLGTWLEDEAGLCRILCQVATQAGVVAAPFRFGRGVEAIHRVLGAQEFWFLFNYREQPSVVELEGTFVEMRDGSPRKGSCTLPAKEYLVLKRV